RTGPAMPGVVGLGTNRPVSGGKTGDPLDRAPGAAPNAGVKTTTNPVVVPAGDVASGGVARAGDGHPPSPAPTVMRADVIAATTVRFIGVPPLPLYHSPRNRAAQPAPAGSARTASIRTGSPAG